MWYFETGIPISRKKYFSMFLYLSVSSVKGPVPGGRRAMSESVDPQETHAL